ncbi:hypothetical protein ABPG72_020651 [Tetrahymena utriculariae]
MEQSKDNLQAMIEHSEQQFRAQFDPTNPLYHQGDKTPVPIGGERVPESMNTMYPSNVNNLNEYINEQTKEINYGPEFDQITQERNQFLNFKKVIASITQVLEAILRHKEHFKTKGDPTNQSHVEKLNENIKKESDKLAAILEEIQPLAKIVLESEFKARYDGLAEILEHAKTEFKNKEDLTDFCFKLKKYSANSFTDAGKLMDKLKKIKKDHAAQTANTNATQEEVKTN